MELVTSVPQVLLCAWIFCRLLPLRRPVWFTVLYTVLLTSVHLLLSRVIPMPLWVKPLLQIVLALGLPCLFTRGTPALRMLHLVPILLLGGASDWLLMRMFRRLRHRQDLQRQVDELERDLEIQEQRSRQLLSQSEGLRHLRHDLHNQLQTAALLLERGAAEEARSLLEQLWAALEPPTPEEGEENPHVQHSDL